MKCEIINKEPVRVGDKFEVLNDFNGFTKGQVIHSIQNSKSGHFKAQSESGLTGIVLIEEGYVRRIGIERSTLMYQIQELEDEIALLKEKVEWMEKTGQDTFDENKFIRYKLPSTIDANATLEEKEDIINEILEKSLDGSNQS